MSDQVIVITGPTACGKSSLAIELARRFDGEVINSDSVQVYRGFDIGSGKPDAASLQAVPHHLFSIMDPAERFDAWQFISRAHQIIAEVQQRGKLPIIVGGTGLYIRSLLCGLVEHGPTSAEAEARLEEIEHELRQANPDDKDFAAAYHQRLGEVDPLAAQVIDSADCVRMRRALECWLSTGTSIELLRREHAHATKKYQALVMCLLPERDSVYARIDARVEQMFAEGLLDEVTGLRSHYAHDAHPFGAIGYREVSAHLDGMLPEQELRESIKRNTRRFAKRQYTWWNNQPAKLGWQDLLANGQVSLEGGTLEIFNPAAIADKSSATIASFLEQSLGLDAKGIALLSIRG